MVSEPFTCTILPLLAPLGPEATAAAAELAWRTGMARNSTAATHRERCDKGIVKPPERERIQLAKRHRPAHPHRHGLTQLAAEREAALQHDVEGGLRDSAGV